MNFPPDIRYDDTDDDYERKMVDIWDLKICGERVLPRNFPRDLYYITPRGHFLSRNIFTAFSIFSMVLSPVDIKVCFFSSATIFNNSS